MTTTSPAVDFPPVVLKRGALADGVPAGATHTCRQADPQRAAAGVGTASTYDPDLDVLDGDWATCHECGAQYDGCSCPNCTPCDDCGREPYFCRCDAESVDPYDWGD